MKIILGFFTGCLLIFLILLPFLKQRVKLDKETEKKNQELQDLNKNISYEYDKIVTQQQEASKSLELLAQQAKKSAEQFYDQNMELAKTNLDNSLEKLSNEIQEEEKKYKEEFLQVLAEASQELTVTLNEKKIKLEETKKQLNRLQANVSAAIQICKNNQTEKLQENKYKIILTKTDLLEINKLREVAPFLRNARPVYKIIWESYYRTPTTELINRLLTDTNSVGIYKITNLNNNMTYIGQTVNISDRLKQHIKCGLGIDAPNNKLYTAMQEEGVENFKFEIIETCSKEELNQQEKYWIDFYQSTDWGYNQTVGGAKKI